MNDKHISKFFSLTFLIFQAYLLSICLTFLLAFICFRLKIRLDQFGSLFFLGLALVVCFIISLIVTHFMTKKYKKAMKDTSECFQKLSHGDFSQKIEFETNDLFINELISNINTIIEELNSITLLKKDFIKNFSHEFKTPISSIKGFSELLYNNPDLPEEEKKKYYFIIKEESTRLANLANMTLLLSKLNTDSIEIKKEYIYIDESIEESAILFYNQFEGKNIKVEIELDHFSTLGNKELIKEVWINLLNNAVKYTNDGGEVLITSTVSDNGYTISFSDTGIGMNESTANHIFDEYYQGNNVNNNTGIGLGLSICKKIVELHNWEISVSSIENEGSTFYIFIPKEK